MPTPDPEFAAPAGTAGENGLVAPGLVFDPDDAKAMLATATPNTVAAASNIRPGLIGAPHDSHFVVTLSQTSVKGTEARHGEGEQKPAASHAVTSVPVALTSAG